MREVGLVLQQGVERVDAAAEERPLAAPRGRGNVGGGLGFDRHLGQLAVGERMEDVLHLWEVPEQPG